MKKNFKRIYRKFKDYNFEKITHNKKINLLWYPRISTQDDLNRELARLAWYCFPIHEKINRITLILDKELLIDLDSLFKVPEYCDSSIIVLFETMRELIKPTSEEIDLANQDIIVLWKSASDISMKQLYPYIIDARTYENQFEANQMLRLSNIFIDKEIEKYQQKKLINFLHDLKLKYSDEVYLFGSGPSVNNFENMNIDIKNSVSIICNSVVKNIELLKTIDPKIIVATDAVFHSGYSKYAAEFRKSLIHAFELFPEMLFIIPMRDYLMYKAVLPNKYESRVIAVKTKHTNNYNINLFRKQILKSTSNVLTAFLLPIAATISKNITMIGFDGKAKEDKNIFWKYDKKSQFIMSIDHTKSAHPAFYHVDYDSYYKKHLEELELLVNLLKFKKFHMKTLGSSNIPVLKLMSSK